MSAGRFNLSALAVRERSITLFLIFLISVAGIVSFFKSGRAEDPAFTVKVMTVVTAWPGATAQEMQDQVAEKIEKRLQELRWYDRSETYTRPGLAFTTLSLLDSTPPAEVQEQFYQARKKVGDEAGNLPAGVIGPMANDEYADVTFALFALKAKGEPQRLLVRDAETLRHACCMYRVLKRSTSLANNPSASLSSSRTSAWRPWESARRRCSPR
jgi:multidrug efflux pump subunit AcrB